LKAGGGISLADCFGIMLANRVSGTLLTSDHHEMDKIATAGICNINFIR
jgi:predicted nucleic acid-binding protein